MKGKLISAIALSLFFVSCQSTTGTNPETVPNNSAAVSELTSWDVHIDTNYFDASSGQLVSKGGLINTSSTDIVAPFRIEGLFYSDHSRETKLGAAMTIINSLRSGAEAQWNLRFSLADKDLSQYSAFVVDDFRVTTKTNQK